jgi:hypothetical protein
MSDIVAAKPGLRQRAIDELKEFLVIALYLLICFTALLYLKAAILQAEGIAFAPFGIAVVKALILAKFMSVGHMMHIGERYKDRALIWPTFYRSTAFLVLLLFLDALEEVVVGLLHHRSIVDSLSEIGGGTRDQFIATLIVMMLILVPFFAFRTLGEAVGESNLVRVFLHGRPQREGS